MAYAIISHHLHLIPRSIAQKLGLRRYFTGEPCSRGHVSERQTSTGQCRTCKSEWADVPEQRAKKNARAKEYLVENKGKIRAYRKDYYAKNREQKLAYGKAYRE